MKPINRLYLSGDEIQVTDINIMLELSAAGRGFVTVKTDEDYTGKLVRLDVGYPELLLRYFTGFVERSQPSANGFQRLFIRELVGVFEREWPCSFQHPTLRTIAEHLQKESGLTFQLPDAPYVDEPIPHFTHSGTGYQLLANLGHVFKIDDYVWQQLPNGHVYVGSWPHSLFANKPVEIPNEFATSQAGGNSMTIPMVQSLRPGVNTNGKPLQKVNLINEDMTLTWAITNKITGKPANKSPIQNQIDNAYPELAAGLHLPKTARIEAHSEPVRAGDISDPYRPRYAVDVQLLDANGNPSSAPIYRAVPLPLPMAGGESGLFQYPPVGTVVEIAFESGRPDKPFIRQTLSQGNTLPDIQPGEQLQQQRQEVSQRITQDGSWQRQTDQTISESSMHRQVTADTEQRTLVTRNTTIQATDKTMVLGTATLLAGAIQQIADGDYSIASKGSFVASINQNANIDIAEDATLTVGQKLIEKVGALKQSIAGTKQEIIAPVVWIGSQEINVAQLMIDTLDIVKELAELTASHSHHNTGMPLNANAIKGTASKSVGLKEKYQPVIG